MAKLFREPDPELSQGDIFDDVPHVHLKGSLEIARKVTLSGGKTAWGSYPYPPVEGRTPAQPFDLKRGEQILTLSRFTRAIVINYDCDLAHDSKFCLVAIVRPMDGVHVIDRPTIRENKNFDHFPLPEDNDLGLREGYVDFRQVTCLEPTLLTSIGKKITSLTPDGLNQFHAALFRFVTRRDLKSSPADLGAGL